MNTMIHRRQLIAAATLAALPAAFAQPQFYPSRALRIVVPFGPGGSSDITARAVGAKLSDAWGQPVTVENLPGAGGELGVTTVVRRPADGYTILVTPNGPITTGGLFRKQPYDVMSDLIPIAQLGVIPSVFAVHPSVPVRTLSEFAAYARALGKPVSCGNPGAGSGNHLAAELLAHAGAFPMTSVPYRGSAASAVALVGGEIQAASGDLSSYLPLAVAGKVRILATYERRRASAAPDIPTVAEAGFPSFGYFTGWIGMFVAGRTPPEIAAQLGEEAARVLQRPDYRATAATMGMEQAVPMSREQLTRYIRDEIGFLRAQVQAAGIKLEG